MTVEPSSSSLLVELFYASDVFTVFVADAYHDAPVVTRSSLPIAQLKKALDDLPSLLESHGRLRASLGWALISDLILIPLRRLASPGARVIFIPHGPFHFLPLHLLILDGAPLIESHAVSYSASTTVLSYCQRRNPKRRDAAFFPSTVAAVALDFVEEADVVSRYFSESQVLLATRDHVTRASIASTVKEGDVVHFSAHGTVVHGNPDESGLVLPRRPSETGGGQQVLSLRDVYSLTLDTYLVTLGACSSALGDYLSGDELIGLTRGFLYAGAPSVIASLWPVENRPTLLLMDRFYHHLMRGGLDKADALRVAQAETRTEYQRPLDWAGFILTGDWL